MNIKDLKPGSYTEVQPLNINNLPQGSYTTAGQNDAPEESLSSKIWNGIASAPQAVAGTLAAVGRTVAPGAVDTLGSTLAPAALLAEPGISLQDKLRAQPEIAAQMPTPLQSAGAGLQLGSLVAGGGTGSLLSAAGAGALSGAANLGGQALTEQKSAGQVATEAAKGGVIGGIIGAAGNLISRAGKEIYKFVLPRSVKEAELLQAYKASTPLLERVNIAAGPSSAPSAAFEKGLVGTEEMLGVQAKKANQSIWSNLIKPQLEASGEKVNMDNFFSSVEQSIIKDNPELNRQSDLLQALSALKEKYVGKTITLPQLQDFKEGWAEFVPEKAYRGQSIAASFNEVKNLAADQARKTIYTALGTDVKQAYFDYGNLKGIEKLGIKAMTGRVQGGSGTTLKALMQMATVPIGTLAGQTVYRVGQGVELFGRAGMATMGQLLKDITTSDSQQSSPEATQPPPPVETSSSPNTNTLDIKQNPDGTITMPGPITGKPFTFDPMGAAGSVSAEGKIAQKAVQFLAKEPPFGVLKDLKGFVNWHDFGELPPNEKDAAKYVKGIRDALVKYGVDAHNMTDLALMRFADTVGKLGEVPAALRDALGRFSK